MIRYSETKTIPPRDLDSLFHSIGWKGRGKKWNEVLYKSSATISAWDTNKLIGMGRIVEDGVMCMFYDIAIHPTYQRQGIGTKIMNKLIQKVKKKKYASIGLFAWEHNEGSVKFYKKFGFILKRNGMELEQYMFHE